MNIGLDYWLRKLALNFLVKLYLPNRLWAVFWFDTRLKVLSLSAFARDLEQTPSRHKVGVVLSSAAIFILHIFTSALNVRPDIKLT
jgi:hypothetical protein